MPQESPNRDRRHKITNPLTRILIPAVLLVFIAIIFQNYALGALTLSPTRLSARISRFVPWTASTLAQQSRANTSLSTPGTMSGRTPVWFFSHGGPNIMEETSHPAYAELQKIGREITQTVRPKAVVVLSAHWQGGSSRIEVNTATSQGLIYDFYGFPAHYYKFQYPNEGSPALAEKVVTLLGQAGIKAEGTRRGLDHGVWAGFMVAFDPKTNPLNVPLVQVSLFDSEDPDQHYALGRAMRSLREEGVQIIASGMSVHNLRDMGASDAETYANAVRRVF
nr:4,5-dopa dioxygenase extradiol [Quercus suber]